MACRKLFDTKRPAKHLLMAARLYARDARMVSQRASRPGATSRGRRVHLPRAGSSSAVANQPSQQAPQQKLLVNVVEALIKFPPLFELARQNARDKIVQRGLAIGDDWDKELAELQKRDWAAALSEVTNPSIQYPSYYTQPFHAYPKGNLSLDAALEVTLAAKSVHATVMDPNGKQLDPQGDHKLRSNYGDRMQQLLVEAGVDKAGVQRVLDLGCATGLSSLALAHQFPGSEVVGVDLSPYFVAVGRYQQQLREAASGKKEKMQLLHGLAEATGQPEGSFDLVSACLLFHELPQDAATNIIREAYRVLRPGGVLAIMEMNPASPIWQRIFGNPIAYAAFKSTEPYLQDYVSLDLHQTIRDAGFTWVQQKENSPRHRSVVAVKGS